VRQLEFVERRRLRWAEAREPVLEAATDAVVRPVAATTCDLDRAIIAGRTPFAGPFAIGHECVAEIVDAGDALVGLRPGALVVVPWHVSCGRCDRCSEGRTAHCRTVPRHAMYGLPVGGDWGGLFSDLVRVPWADHALVPVPDGLDPGAVASAGDNLTDAWRAVEAGLAARPGAEVLVVGGTASVGIYAAAFAVAQGAGRVVYVDRDADRRRVAGAYGAETVQALDAERPREFPVTVDASAEPAGLVLALRATGPTGHCHSVGIYFAGAHLPLGEMYMNAVTLTTGRSDVRPSIPAVLDAVATGAVDPTVVFSETVDWDDLPEALAELPRKPLARRP
jgi:alcohol dehydrogenase